MPDYTKYYLKDFMSDPYFRAWVKNNTTDVDNFWEKWIAEHPEKNDEVLKARELLQGIWTTFDEIDDAEIEQRIKVIIHQLNPIVATPSRSFSWFVNRSWSLAAAAVVVVAVLFFWRHNTPSTHSAVNQQLITQDKTVSLVEQKNTTNQPLLLHLPDGSSVSLTPQSQISYPDDIGKSTERRVYLTGEAFFDVKRSPHKPFVVLTHDIVTRVLGTSFWVKSNEDASEVSVSVKTGKVSVYPGRLNNSEASNWDAANGILLDPNQEAKYIRAENRLIKTLVEHPVIVNAEVVKKQAVFDEAPLAEVFQSLEKAYGIKIIYDEETFKNCYITAKIYDEPLSETLQLLCKIINATSEIVDGQIVITGNGC